MSCRHLHHVVEPQHHIWKGGAYKRTVPAQVFCRDCNTWLYEKPIDWDHVPRNATERREARIADSSPNRPSAQQIDQPRPTGRADTG